MFESAELGHTLAREKFRAEVPALREALLEAQAELLEKKSFSALVIIGGVDGAGKGETVNTLNEWMDPRHIHTHALGAPSDEEAARPAPWRFWRALPPKGKIGIFFGSWYTQPIIARTYGQTRAPELDQSLEEIVRFEKMLHDEGVVVLKLWFHLSKAQQKKRLRALSKDPRTAWRVTDTDWKHFKLYDDFRAVSEHALRATSTGHATWHVIEGLDARYRELTAGRLVLETLRARLDAPPAPPPVRKKKAKLAIETTKKGEGPPNLLRALDLKRRVAKAKYDEQLEALQGKIALLTRHPRFRETGLVVVFEGVDAAGKGGAIRRITQALDARHYRVHPVAAPSSEERAQPYLWRFWRNVPPLGEVAIFDRSWYGRVLVERVEGFCSDADWQRAYSEINDFEARLSDRGLMVVKFWLHVDPAEQLKRFQERKATGFKRFKITAEDWRNREKWPAYEIAACDMFDQTSTASAPWTLVPANDKRVARLLVLETLADRLSKAIEHGNESKKKSKK
ncbi:MAG: polyphosphate:AMP phosphotransferase [Sandaracinus sp.]